MSVSAESLWASCLASLKTMLKPELYDLWFSPLRARSLVEEVLTLEVGDEFTQMWINDNYLDLLRSVVSRTAVQPIQVEFVVVPRLPVLETPPPVVLEEAPAVEAAAPDSASNGRPSETLLSPNYTFSTFVVGNNNEFAHSASRAVAHNPGKAFNPLVLFGGVGLGKTHLLHAIGHEINAAKRNGGKVAYITCERFTNEFIAALQENQLTKFRNKYRKVETLLVDDIQFLAGKERIQEEFFHTFNTLHESRKQIVMTCDRPASRARYSCASSGWCGSATGNPPASITAAK